MAGSKFNYRSDFDLILRLRNTEGTVVPFPEFNWSARFHTSMRNVCYVASCRDGVYTNCFRESDGSMHFVFQNHGLCPGRLLCDFLFENPNVIYASGIQKLFDPQFLDFELVDGRTDCATTAEVQAMLPYIKGEPFRWEDFTPEHIEILQRPAKEAADRLDSFRKSAASQLGDFLGTATANENERRANENERISAEQERARVFSSWEDIISPNIPIEVESEEAMQALIEAGNAKDGHFYFIPEEEE